MIHCLIVRPKHFPLLRPTCLIDFCFNNSVSQTEPVTFRTSFSQSLDQSVIHPVFYLCSHSFGPLFIQTFSPLTIQSFIQSFINSALYSFMQSVNKWFSFDLFTVCSVVPSGPEVSIGGPWGPVLQPRCSSLRQPIQPRSRPRCTATIAAQLGMERSPGGGSRCTRSEGRGRSLAARQHSGTAFKWWFFRCKLIINCK